MSKEYYIINKTVALNWAKENLIGKSFAHKQLDKLIRFTKQGIKHSLSARTNELKIVFVYNLPKILKRSIIIDIQLDKKNRPQIRKIYKLFVEWKYNNKEYFVYIILREGVNGIIYYDHTLFKEKKH